MTALFSGRFDPLNAGHIATIAQLGQKYENIVVVVLQYPDRISPVHDQIECLSMITKNLKGNYEILWNYDHFGRITTDKADVYKFDVYCSGNQQCVDHMKTLGYRAELVPRYGNYSSTDIRVGRKFRALCEC